MTKLQDFDQRQNVMDKLQKYDLLVIDDLGVERDTSYSLEQVYNIIDTRSRAGKPLIVTTNLTLEDLQNPASIEYARIYDRILEMCPIRLKLIGESRRKDNAERRRIKAKEIMQAANEKPAYGDDYSEVYKWQYGSQTAICRHIPKKKLKRQKNQNGRDYRANVLPGKWRRRKSCTTRTLPHHRDTRSAKELAVFGASKCRTW